MRVHGVDRAVLLVVLVGLTTAAACATNPVSGKKQVTLMSEAQEIELGHELDLQVRQEMGVYDDPELQRYVEEIGLELARNSHRPNLPWTFAIVDSPAVNAFALPGGHIYITRGILAYLSDEAELAGVLGHEVGHVTARHAVEQYTRAAGTNIGLTIASIFLPGARPYGDLAATGLGILFLKYGRDDELQSDRLGAEYAARSGWDPEGVAGMLRTLSRLDEANASDRQGTPGWLSTHPAPAERVDRVNTTVEMSRALLGDASGKVRRDEFIARIDGLVFGENPREGIVRGHVFVHPDLRFALEFPEGWEVVNLPEQVVANEPGTRHYMVLDLVKDTTSRALGDIAQQSMRSAGFRYVGAGSAESFNGLEAWVGTFEGNLKNVGAVIARVAFIAHGRNAYRVAGFAPRDTLELITADVERSQRSFRALTREEARDIEPNRVSVYTVREGETWQGIAQRAGQGIVKASTLAIMNGFPPAEQPRPGDRIKIVIAG